MNVQSSELVSKRQAIMQSMLSLIYEYGIQGTPMSLVAKQAGVSPGTIYHYFESKDDLIYQIVHDIRLAVHDNFFKPEYESLDYYNQFKNGWISLAKFFYEHPQYIWFLEQFSNSPYAQKEKMEDKIEPPFFVRFRLLIEEGKRQQIIRNLDTTLVSIVLYGCIISAVKCGLKGITEFNENTISEIFEISWVSIYKNQ